MKSEVFEEYIKIMQSGLTKNAQRANLDDRNKQKPTKKEKDIIEYKSNLMEEAHPNRVIFGPSYDPMHSLIENNIERNQIMLKIVHKNPTGQLDHKKYAESDLQLSLIKIANELDFNDKDQLRILADNCIGQIKKKAGFGLTAGIIAGVIALTYIYQHFSSTLKTNNIDAAKENLIEKIDDALQEEVYSFGLLGEEFKESTKTELNKLKSAAIATHAECKKIEKIIDHFKTPMTAEEIVEFSKTQKAQNSIPVIFERFSKFINNVEPLFNTIAKDYSNKVLQELKTKEKGWLTDKIDSVQILRGGFGLFRNLLDEVADATKGMLKTVNEYKKVAESVMAKKSVVEADVSNTKSEPDIELPELKPGTSELAKPTESPTAPSTPTQAPGAASPSEPPKQKSKKYNPIEQQLLEALEQAKLPDL